MGGGCGTRLPGLGVQLLAASRLPDVLNAPPAFVCRPEAPVNSRSSSAGSGRCITVQPPCVSLAAGKEGMRFGCGESS
jgi:hypothetical protein